MDMMDDVEFEIFDEATSKKIQDEHQQDMADAAKAIGTRRMGLMTGESEKSTATPSAAGTGLMSKLASATSLFSRKKAPELVSAAAPAAAAPAQPAPAAPAAASNSAQPSRSALPPPPPGVAKERKPEAPTPAKEEEEDKQKGRPPQEPATVQPVTVAPPDIPGAEKEALALPATAAPASELLAQTPTEEPPVTRGSRSEEKGEGDVEGGRTGSTSTSAAPVEPQPAMEALLTSTVAPDRAAAAEATAAEAVLPELKVVPFDVREPSLGAAVVGHVAILEGSCYVWAGTEGSSAQGSLAAAVGTRFDGGMPTATPLLAGEGAGGAGASGGVSVSMAQRLCRRTGRVVFVSCDLSEDSQILVAAVEAKVVALLKADA